MSLPADELATVVACDNVMVDAFHALDVADLDAFVGYFVEDMSFGPMTSKAQVLEMLGSRPPLTQSHQVLNRRVWVDSPTDAHARCVIAVYHFAPDRQGPLAPSMVMRGSFTFRYQNDAWKIVNHAVDEFLGGGFPGGPSGPGHSGQSAAG
jgi:hypothetical protein